jgi:membrane protein
MAQVPPTAPGTRASQASYRWKRDDESAAMLRSTIAVLKQSFQLFSANRAASRGAAIAFYAVTSVAPVLLMVIAVAGLVFGREAASGALFAQFRGLLGTQGADFLQRAVANASGNSGSIAAAAISIVTLIATASGVFLELEDALNAMWQARPEGGFVEMAVARLTSLGLVIALGFLLLVSLVVDAALQSLRAVINSYVPFGNAILLAISFVIVLGLMTLVFAAIFRYLPVRRLPWRDLFAGGFITALLFEIGKFLIGIYLGSRTADTSLGAAGALLGIFVWVYYSAQLLLFGAALTMARFEQRTAKGAKAP